MVMLFEGFGPSLNQLNSPNKAVKGVFRQEWLQGIFKHLDSCAGYNLAFDDNGCSLVINKLERYWA
jgi:hypothetical protein